VRPVSRGRTGDTRAYNPATAAIQISCPFCGGTLSQKPSRFGRFFGCSGFPQCEATVGCHPDGEPLGTPANAPLKAARQRVHDVFDELWEGKGPRVRRKAYDALAHTLRLDTDDCHIAMFDLALCERAIAAIERGDVVLEDTVAEIRAKAGRR